MWTPKRGSSVNSAFCPSASRRSAQCAYASNSSRKASRSAASAGVSSVWTAIDGSSSESNQVDAREGGGNLLHRAACGQVAEVDCGEARVLEQRDYLRFRVGVVAGDENDGLAAGVGVVRGRHP